MREASSHSGDSAAVSGNTDRAGPRPSRIELAWLPIVAAGLLLIYLPGLGNSLVFDDSYLNEGLFSDYASLLHPHVRMLSYGSFVWIHALFGDGWWKQRLFNLAAHGAVVVSLWALYREILRHIALPAGESPESTPYYRSPALGVAVGFFALNPVAVYAVGYLIQRTIVLATLFSVLGLWFFARGLREKRPVMHALALACYGLAAMSKEHAVLVPFAAVPLYILVVRPGRRHLALLVAAGSVLVAIAAGLLYLRYGDVLGKPFDEYSHLYLNQLSKLDTDARRHAWPLSVMNEAWLFFRYGLDWLVPYSGWMSINLRPPFPVHWLTFPQILGVVAYPGVLFGGFFLLIRYRDGRALLGLSLLFPALLFATEFATVWVQDPFALYRSYLWAIGVPGLVFYAIHGPSARTLLVAGVALGAVLSWQSLDRVFSMASAETVWTDAIEKLPDDPRSVGRWFPYLNRGTAYVEHNDFDRAVRDFQASAALGDEGMGAFNIGSILSAQGHHREALAAFDRARKEGYDVYNLPFQRGLALLALGQVQAGSVQMQITLAADPPSPIRELALLNLGRAEMQLGQRDEAVRTLEQLVAREPGHKEGRYLLGMAYVMKGEPQRALPVLDRLIREGPNPGAYYARAIANYALRRKPEALSDIDNALRLGPDNPNLREWQAKIRAMP